MSVCYVNLVKLFNKLDWLPTDDIIRTRKLVMMYKITKRSKTTSMVIAFIRISKQTHNYSTRPSTMNNIVIPKCRNNSGLRTFHSSCVRMWNFTGVKL